MMKNPSQTSDHKTAQTSGHNTAGVVLLLAPVFWGLVLLGVATWLTSRQAVAAAIACLVFSAGYFVFAWSIIRDSTCDEARALDDANESPLYERRAPPNLRRLGRDSRGLQKTPSRREPRRSSHGGAA